ncbi:MAG TPA: choice-of-anchor Q domain-containing protein [Dehalococcoidia bacterium]
MAERGGGIAARDGFLLLENSVVTGNVAAESPSEVGIGGGVYTDAPFDMENSTISNNVADLGGGGLYVDDGGDGDILTSTFSGNRSDDGPGITVNVDGSLRILLSTVSNNTAEFFGGGINNNGSIEASFVTIAANSAANGGGIWNNDAASASFVLRGVLIADNTATAGPDCLGTPTSLGYNLIEDAAACTMTSTTGDITDTEAFLGPLQSNGGPTQTHGLLAGSPALDAVASDDCEDADGIGVGTDQRGVTRPQEGDGVSPALCDIGAFEARLFTLDVTLAGSGSGTVTSNPAGITCGTTCDAIFLDGTGVTLTAAPDAGSVFAGWSGDCSGTASATTVIVLDDLTCTAAFQPAPTPTPTPTATPVPSTTPLPPGVRLPETGGGPAGRPAVPAALLAGALLLAGGALALRRAR